MDSVKVLTIQTDQAQKSVKDLRNELKELRNQLLSTEKGTKEYYDTLQKAANVQHDLKEQMEEINATAMDFGQITGNVIKGLNGMVAGFQAAKATLNLFGIENETVLKSLQKMQNLMAITQALPAIEGSIKAFKRLAINIRIATAAMSGFSKAMIATGIGAIVAAVGLLAANWDKVAKALGITTAEQKKYNEEAQKKYIEGLKEEVNLEKQIGQLQGKTDRQVLEASVQKLEESLSLIAAQQFMISNQIEEWEGLLERGSTTIQQYYVATRPLKKELEGLGNEYKTVNELLQEYNRKLTEAKELEKVRDSIQNDPNSYANLSKAIEDSNAALNTRIKFLQDLEKIEKPEVQNSELLTISVTEYTKAIDEANIELEKYKNLLDENDPRYSSDRSERYIYENLVRDYNDYVKVLESAKKELQENIVREKQLEEARKKAEGKKKEEAELKRLNEVLENYNKAQTAALDVENYGTEGARFIEILTERKKIVEDLEKAVEKGVEGAKEALEDFSNNADYLYKQAKQSAVNVISELSSRIGQIYNVNTDNNDFENYLANQLQILNNARDLALISVDEYNNAVKQIGDLGDINSVAAKWGTDFEGFISTINSFKNEFLTTNEEMYSQWLEMMEYALQKGIVNHEQYNVIVKKLQEEQTANLKVHWSQWTMMAGQMLSELGSVFTSISSMEKRDTEESLQHYKDVATSGAVISMLGGVVGAIASAFNPANAWMTIYGQIAMASLTAASVIASGIAQIDQIQKTELNSGYTPSSPSSSSLGSIIAPVQYTQDVQGASIEGAIKDSRVYVVESDISKTQRKVAVTEQEARF